MNNFVNSAVQSLKSHIDSLLKYNSSMATPDQINKFLIDTVDKYLSTVGVAIYRDKDITSHIVKRYSKVYRRIKSKAYLKGIETTIDSGGYQIQNGFVNKKSVYNFIDIFYKELIPELKDEFDYIFSLDIAPGIDLSIYDDEAELEKMLRLSYNHILNIDKDYINKCIYIHHFRTPELNRVYSRVLNDIGYQSNIQNFGTGGVTESNKTFTSPIVQYCLPLIPIISYLKSKNIKSSRFHVLGVGGYKDIIIHKLMERHVKEIHDIDLKITYDSASLFKSLAVSRFTYYVDHTKRSYHKMFFKSNDLDLVFKPTSKTVKELLISECNDIIVPYGMSPLTNSFFTGNKILENVIYTYGFFHMLNMYKLIDTWCDEFLDEAYPLIKNDAHIFVQELDQFITNLNGHKRTRSTFNRSTSIFNSLEMVKELDMEFYNYSINNLIT